MFLETRTLENALYTQTNVRVHNTYIIGIPIYVYVYICIGIYRCVVNG